MKKTFPKLSLPINQKRVKPNRDPCGLIRELYHSANLSIAHNTIVDCAREHLHSKIDETYYVLKGKGQLVINKNKLEIREGDIIPVEKNNWHYLKKTNDEPLEVLVITYPRYNPKDLFLTGH
ncbi:MAG: cupin domain-containing protein [Patescibacteria group bacterium]